MHRRYPTYQLHLPPKTRFKSIWERQKPFPGNAGKLREIQGFLFKKEQRNKGKGRSRQLREIHSGDPEWAFGDDFPWRMRMAKVDMLGTEEEWTFLKRPVCQKTPSPMPKRLSPRALFCFQAVVSIATLTCLHIAHKTQAFWWLGWKLNLLSNRSA